VGFGLTTGRPLIFVFDLDPIPAAVAGIQPEPQLGDSQIEECDEH
jgi:hypothetical protein